MTGPAPNRELLDLRLRNQHLAGPPAASAAAAVSDLLAIQAQDHVPGLWSVSQRAGDPPLSDVQAALDAGAIVRVHVLRPTWHLVAAGDLGWLQAVTGPRVRARNSSFYARLGIDDEMLARSRALLRAALAGGNELTMAQLGQALEAGGMELGNLHLIHYVMDLELRGELCSGPRHGKQRSYMLAEDRLGESDIPDDEECLRRLVLRYFAGHGPATIKDLSVWSSMTLAQLRPAIAELADRLGSFEADGRRYYYLPSSSNPSARTGGGAPSDEGGGGRVWLLQQFDELGIGYRESRDALGPAAPVSRINPGEIDYFNPIVTSAGIAGWWRARAKTRSVDFDITQVAADGVDAEALASEQERYRRFRLR